jgi:hypothetical protein
MDWQICSCFVDGIYRFKMISPDFRKLPDKSKIFVFLHHTLRIGLLLCRVTLEGWVEWGQPKKRLAIQ